MTLVLLGLSAPIAGGCDSDGGCGLPPVTCVELAADGTCGAVVTNTVNGCTPCPAGTRDRELCPAAGADGGALDGGGTDAGMDGGASDAAALTDGSLPDAAALGADFTRCVARCERGNMCSGAPVDCTPPCVEFAEDVIVQRARVVAAGCEEELELFLTCLDEMTCMGGGCSPRGMQDCIDAFCASNPSDPVCM